MERAVSMAAQLRSNVQGLESSHKDQTRLLASKDRGVGDDWTIQLVDRHLSKIWVKAVHVICYTIVVLVVDFGKQGSTPLTFLQNSLPGFFFSKKRQLG